ncbi:MAG: nickel-dependent hydrogenase large subunit [Coriobacteriales bacterium]|nr:nickel-dependent hydrogenase large subunit [Coriobacteriales bacterium]MBQ6586565.1 nickel-dependent hydrogenase large subunit [Coriobacteriales bacterium]
MAKQTIIPFGPQHPVLPEPVHLDLVVEDETVVQAIPRIGFVHRGLEKLVEKKDYTQFVFVTERICGICSFGHSLGYSQTIEHLMGIEVPPRAEYLRVILHELSRVHSHLLWLGLGADAFGFENLFMQCWRIRERVLDIFEKTTGGRVVLSACNVGGTLYDIDDETLKGICATLDVVRREYDAILGAFLNDYSVRSRLEGVGYLSQQQARDLSIVGPFARASNVNNDVRCLRQGGYAYLESFEPIMSDGGDCLARVIVRAKEVYQSIDIIKELAAKIPAGPVMNAPKGKPAAGTQASMRLEQPRGECYYYAKGNGSMFLERMRIRTPTSQNLGGLVVALAGCDLADVPNIVLTIDPCISCTER